MILSGVRCNNRHDIGFVKNPNRMNVAISRMKMRIIVVGSEITLCTNPNWAELFKVAKFVSDIDDIPLLSRSPDLPIGRMVSCSVSRIMACPTIEKELQRRSDPSYNETKSYGETGRGGGRGRGRGGGRGYKGASAGTDWTDLW